MHACSRERDFSPEVKCQVSRENGIFQQLDHLTILGSGESVQNLVALWIQTPINSTAWCVVIQGVDLCRFKGEVNHSPLMLAASYEGECEGMPPSEDAYLLIAL